MNRRVSALVFVLSIASLFTVRSYGLPLRLEIMPPEVAYLSQEETHARTVLARRGRSNRGD
jgi:hypothetical protein